MTMHYILTDKALRAEIEQVTRELRIMRCQGVLEDIRAALHTPNAPAFGGHGGGAVPLLSEAIKAKEEELHQKGQDWDADTTYELALHLTLGAKALTMIVENALNTNKMLKGPAAFELGVADAMFAPAEFLEASIGWAAKVVSGAVTVTRPEIPRDEATWTGAIAAIDDAGRPQDEQAVTGSVSGDEAGRGRAHRHPRRGLRRRG